MQNEIDGCSRVLVCVCARALSRRLARQSRPGLLSGTQPSSRKWSAADVKHLQAPAMGSSLSEEPHHRLFLSTLIAACPKAEVRGGRGREGGRAEDQVEVVHLTRGYAASIAIATRLPWTPSIRAFQSNAEDDFGRDDGLITGCSPCSLCQS